MIDDATRNYMRAKLHKYDEIKKEVQLFEESLRHPFQETDDNIGGGKSNLTSSPVEREAIAVMSNRQLTQKLRLLNMIDYVLNSCEPQIKHMMELRYQKKWQWVKIAEHTKYSESACRKIDKKVLDRMITMLGY